MPTVKANGLTINFDEQGSGEPLVLIPYLAADHACYAFQVAEYAKHFTCISLDLRGAGETDKPEGSYSTELFADDVAAFMQALGIQKAHVSGLSLGAATGMWLAAKYPGRVKSLSLHAAWIKTDYFLQTVVGTWQVLAKALGSVHETIIQGIFPWCLTPELFDEAGRNSSGPHSTSMRSGPRSRLSPSSSSRMPYLPTTSRLSWDGVRRADPDHLRAARTAVLDAIRRAHPPQHSGVRSRGVRGLHARADL